MTLSSSLFSGGWFSPRWSSSSFVTGRWWFQTILWGPTPSTRSSNGPTASPWPCKPHATHQAQHHPPPPSAPPHAHSAHAEPRRVKKCSCFLHTNPLNILTVTQHCLCCEERSLRRHGRSVSNVFIILCCVGTVAGLGAIGAAGIPTVT